MAAAPGRTIFNRSEIQTLGKSELISALLENDEDLLEAELSRKSNDELKQDLTKQSDQLLAEVRKKNEEVDGPEDDELDCDPLVSGDCAPKEPFEFFENDLAPPGQDRVITPAEMEVRELKAEISEANQYQQKQDVVFRNIVKGLLVVDSSSATFNSNKERKFQNIAFKVDSNLVKHYNHRVYANDTGNREHIKYFQGTTDFDDLQTLSDFDLLQQDLDEMKSAEAAYFSACTDATFASPALSVNIEEVKSLLDYFDECPQPVCAKECKRVCIYPTCEYFCGFFSTNHSMKMCALQNLMGAGVIDPVDKTPTAVGRVTRFVVLCLTNLDLNDFRSAEFQQPRMKEILIAAKLWVQRNSTDVSTFTQAMVLMNAYLLFIQRFIVESNKPDVYVDTMNEYLEFIHEVRYQSINSRIEPTIKKSVLDMIEDIHLVVGFIVKKAVCGRRPPSKTWMP